MKSAEALSLTALPYIARVARSLHIDVRQDSSQEGYLTALEMARNHKDSEGNHYFPAMWKSAVRTSMLREAQFMSPEETRIRRAGYDAVAFDTEVDEQAADEVAEFHDQAIDPSLAPDEQRLRDELIEAIGRLTPSRVGEIVAGVLAGYTVSDMARDLDMSQSSADRLFQKGINDLRKLLG